MFDTCFPSPHHLNATLAITLTTLGFIAFWSVVTSRKIIPRLAGRFGTEQAQELKIYVQRLVGIFGFGIIPAFIFFTLLDCAPSDFGLSAQWTSSDFWWSLGLSALATLLSYLGASKPESLEMYPEIRRSVWGFRTLALSALSWTAYLFAYELTFRGFLLFSCYHAFGTGTAIAINTSIYALAHVPKRMTEGIGAIVLGIVLCSITLQTGTIWVAVLVHTVLSLSNEWFSLRFNPNVRYGR